MNEYNSKIEDQSVENQASNKRAWTDFEQSISPQDSKKKVADKIRHLKARVRKCPKKIVFKPNRNTFKRFNRAMGNVHRSTNTHGNYLAQDDPRMIAALEATRTTIQENQILCGLVLPLGFSLASCFQFLF